MNELDWVIVSVIGVSALFSLLRGFVKEAISLFLWLFSLGLALALCSKLAMLIEPWIAHPTLRQIVAFVGLFLATILVGGLLGQLLSSVLKRAGLGFFDRILGMAFGATRGAVIVLVAVLLLPYAIAVEQMPWWQQSTLVPHFVMMEEWAIEVFSDVNQWRLSVVRDAAS